MARLVRLLAGAFCTLTPLLSGAGPAPELPLGVVDCTESAARLSVSKESLEQISISLDSPDIRVTNQVEGFEVFQVFSIGGERMVAVEGNPVVPQVTRFYRIPDVGGVDLVVEQAEYDLIENVNPLPYRDSRSEGDVTRNAEVYSADAWYPPQVAVASEPMLLRDFRVATVALYPVQVNPVTHQARIYHTLRVSLAANESPSVNEVTRPRQPSRAWAPVYRAVIANLDEGALDKMTTRPGSYLIISKSDASVQPWVDSLRIWKKRCGYEVRVEARASWTTTAMRDFIRTAYATWDPPLEFVTLMGSPLAPWGVPTYTSDYDHIFALGNAGDDLEDIGVGRLCATTVAELATVNAKIMGYERNPYLADTLWFKKAFLYTHVGYGQGSNLHLMQWAAQQLSHFTGVNYDTVVWSSGSVDENLMQQQFAAGIGLFLWEGSWIGQMSSALPPTLESGWRLPVTATLYEATGDFQSGTCIAQQFLVAGTPNAPRAGVCGIGSATTGSHWAMVTSVMAGFVYSMANLGVENLGVCLSAAKLWLSLTWGAGSQEATFHSRVINLLGEPSLSIWTDTPVVMAAQHPDTVAVGARQVQLVVQDSAAGTPVANATVVLWKGDETYSVGQTDSAGSLGLPVNIQSSGDLLLTVTKRNHKPYLRTLPCVVMERMVAMRSYALDDDSAGGTFGNGDGQLNPGEMIDIPVWLWNAGSTDTGTAISALLTSANPRVTIVNDSATYPDLAPGDSALGSAPFRIQVSSNLQHDESVVLFVTVTASGIPTCSEFDLVCRAPRLEYVASGLTPPLDPGTESSLTVTLRNSGAIVMRPATAQLYSLSPVLMVSDPFGAYASLQAGQQAANAADPFQIAASPLAYRGSQAPMMLVCTAADGFVDTVEFVLSIGQASPSDPTGPDGGGYYAYDNEDTLYDLHPTYDYVEIDSVGNNLNLADPGEQTAITPVYSTARPLPFVFRFYGQLVDSITVCSNGWCAFGDQSWTDAFRNYPIPGILAPDLMIAPYWDDLRTQGTGLGVWDYYDEAAHRYIIQWKAQGLFGDTHLDFEVILYDEAFYPTADHNGMVLMQYRQVQMNLQGDYAEPPGCDIGIQGLGGLVGLSYAHVLTYSPGAAPVVNGRAILFTTENIGSQGRMEGHVSDAASGLPVAAARVSLDGSGYCAFTDSTGFYRLEYVVADTYLVRASAHRYNEGVAADVVVRMDTTTVVDFALLHPEMALSTDTLRVALGAQTLDTTFGIMNQGNGPLDCRIHLRPVGPDTVQPWEAVSTIDITGVTGNGSIQGCEFAGDHWWISAHSAPRQPALFYRFDYRGNYVDSIPQPFSTSVGWFDLAWDGEYVYGSDGPYIMGVDSVGTVRAFVLCPVNPARAVAYDPLTDHFWAADYASSIFELSRMGNVIQEIPRSPFDSLLITGLAWHSSDPDNCKLYLFGRRLDNTGALVSKMNPETHAVQCVAELSGRPGDYAAGCAITAQWNGLWLAFGGILRNAQGDQLSIRQIAVNETWISVTPAELTVAAHGLENVTVSMNPATLRPFTYFVNADVRSAIQDTTMVLPLVIQVLDLPVNDPHSSGMPDKFALYQNYPNPFNPITGIRFDLPQAARVQLKVFNTLGQLVATLVDETRAAGAYRVAWDGQTVASGLYIYQLTAGSFTDVKKMVLIR